MTEEVLDPKSEPLLLHSQIDLIKEKLLFVVSGAGHGVHKMLRIIGC